VTTWVLKLYYLKLIFSSRITAGQAADCTTRLPTNVFNMEQKELSGSNSLGDQTIEFPLMHFRSSKTLGDYNKVASTPTSNSILPMF